MKIVAVDDTPLILKQLEIILTEAGHEFFSTTAGTYGFDLIMQVKPEIIILDVTMPGIKGTDICTKIREKSDSLGKPFIFMLSGTTDRETVEKSYYCGANDFIRKPFCADEIVAKINSYSIFVERTRMAAADAESLEYKEIRLCTDKREVCSEGEKVRLSKNEFDLLKYFILNKGIVLSREKILTNVWKEESYTVNDRSVDTTVSRLRRKIHVLDENINSIFGIGYKLAE